MAIIRYNQAVVGVHEYYSMATMINEDVHKLFPRDVYKRQVYEVDGSDTDEEADLLNFDDLDSDEFV